MLSFPAGPRPPLRLPWWVPPGIIGVTALAAAAFVAGIFIDRSELRQGLEPLSWLQRRVKAEQKAFRRDRPMR